MMTIERCHHCRDIGVWILPSGLVTLCPGLHAGRPHNAAGAAAKVLAARVSRIQAEGRIINGHLFDLAVRLCSGTSSEPVPRDVLIDRHFSYVAGPSRLRKLHAAIEDLRRIWGLPVGTRKEDPAGYWICTELADFRQWVERSKAAPVKQLSTIYHVAKLNFPFYAQQLELEFSGSLSAPSGSGVDAFRGRGGPVSAPH